MALKQFISQSIQWIPQSGFTIAYTENGGIEATQDIVISKSKFNSTTSFVRGVRWDSLFPEVPNIYRSLTLKTRDPVDRGDGFFIIKCTFTGYEFTGNGSSGQEGSVATSTLSGQLEDVPLSQHRKWKGLAGTAKTVLGYLLSGVYVLDPTETKIMIPQDDGSQVENATLTAYLVGDALEFAKIIASGESTYRRGGWTYSYHTESSSGFSGAQLSSLGKIVANPPGGPVDPGAGWLWLLAGPNQTQSGTERFMKTLDFQLIQNNETNQFLYG